MAEQLSMGFATEAISVTVRRGYGGWIVERRAKGELQPWGELVRYERLTFDEALDVAFIEVANWDNR